MYAHMKIESEQVRSKKIWTRFIISKLPTMDCRGLRILKWDFKHFESSTVNFRVKSSTYEYFRESFDFKNFCHSHYQIDSLKASTLIRDESKQSILKWDDDVVYEIVIALEAISTSFKFVLRLFRINAVICFPMLCPKLIEAMKWCSMRREHRTHKKSLSVNKKWEVEKTKIKLERFKKSSWVVVMT